MLRILQFAARIFRWAGEPICNDGELILRKEGRMFEDDRSYYQHRAEVELESAQKATVPEVVRAHHLLAEAYLGKLASAAPTQADAS